MHFNEKLLFEHDSAERSLFLTLSKLISLFHKHAHHRPAVAPLLVLRTHAAPLFAQGRVHANPDLPRCSPVCT